MTTQTAARHRTSGTGGIMDRLNGPWHERALQVYLFIVVAHWVEHIVQAVQIFTFGWARPDAKGALGLMWPWLVSSEWLHYVYAIVMLVGLFVLRPGFVGRSRMWWDIAFVIQFWHHIEHALLLGQKVTGHNLFGKEIPTSVLQLVVMRVELHLFYNAVVFIPMLIAMYYHLRPPAGDPAASCSCALKRQSSAA